jgi:hypothetical protein
MVLAKYNDYISKENKDIMLAIENNDIGKIKDVGKIISFKNLLELKDRFILEE